MNGDDQFETQLRGQPQRRIPPAWREEILRAAREGAASHPPVSAARASRAGTFASLWLNLLWPHPKAWAGLGAVWLVVLGLNLAARDASLPQVAGVSAPPSPAVRQTLRQREQMLVELVGPLEKPEAVVPKPAAVQPRSQRRLEFLTARLENDSDGRSRPEENQISRALGEAQRLLTSSPTNLKHALKA